MALSSVNTNKSVLFASEGESLLTIFASKRIARLDVDGHLGEPPQSTLCCLIQLPVPAQTVVIWDFSLFQSFLNDDIL